MSKQINQDTTLKDMIKILTIAATAHVNKLGEITPRDISTKVSETKTKATIAASELMTRLKSEAKSNETPTPSEFKTPEKQNTPKLEKFEVPENAELTPEYLKSLLEAMDNIIGSQTNSCECCTTKDCCKDCACEFTGTCVDTTCCEPKSEDKLATDGDTISVVMPDGTIIIGSDEKDLGEGIEAYLKMTKEPSINVHEIDHEVITELIKSNLRQPKKPTTPKTEGAETEVNFEDFVKIIQTFLQK